MTVALFLQAADGTVQHPLHVVQDSASILPMVLSVVVIAIPIATFWINHYRAEQERRGSSYFKLVVEPSQTDVTGSFDAIEKGLQSLAELARMANLANRPYEVGIRRRLAETLDQVDTLQNRILDRLGIIGLGEGVQVSLMFQELRNAIMNFGDWSKRNPTKPLDTRISLVDHQRNILGALYEREFRSFRRRF